MLGRPAFGLAEVAWRWSFGAATAALLMFCLLEYLRTLPVSDMDLWLLRTRQPTLVGQALADIFRGSSPRLVEAGIMSVLVLAITWIFVASLGRAAITSSLLAYFRTGASAQPAIWHWRSLLGLNLLRVAATLAASLAFFGGIFLGQLVASKNQSPLPAVLIFLSVVLLALTAWLVLNWFLSLASLFVLAEGCSTFDSLAATLDLILQRTGAVFAVSIWFGLAHGIVFFVASSLVALPLAFAGVLPAGVIIGGLVAVTLLYFAVVDFLHAGRMAGYAAILQFPPSPSLPPFDRESPPDSGRVDPDELILSDTPVMA